MIEYLLFLLGTAFGIGFMALFNVRSYHKGYNDGRKFTLNNVYGKYGNSLSRDFISRYPDMKEDDDV